MLKKLFGGNSDKRKTEQVEIINAIRHPENYYTISAAVMDEIRELAKSSLSESKLHTNDIPAKKLATLTDIYSVKESSIIAFYDTTVFKTAKDGMVLGDHFIGLKQAFGSPVVFSYEDFVKAALDDGNKKLRINHHQFNLGLEKLADFLQQVKVLLISKDPQLANNYEGFVSQRLNEIEANLNAENYSEAENEFLTLEKVVTSNNNELSARLYHYGVLLALEKFNFDKSARYFSLLEQLHVWENNKLAELQQSMNLRKSQYEFDMLDKQKDTFIHAHQFDKAIEIVAEQRQLNIASNEQLDQERNRILKEKDAYIQALETKVEEKLQLEEFTEVLSILDELKQMNPSGSYEEYDIRARTGLFEFAEVEEKINTMKETDQALAATLEENLELAKKHVFTAMRDAVRQKEYSFFKEHPELRNRKDSWGMTPLMHFIVHKDLDGVKLLANTFNPNERNILGHTAFHLLEIHTEDTDFYRDVLLVLDETLIRMMKEHKGKVNANKIKSLAIKGLDTINTRTMFDVDLLEATSNAEADMSAALEDSQREIVAYLERFVTRNAKEFVTFVTTPRDLNQEYSAHVDKLKNLEEEAGNLQEKVKHQENSYEMQVAEEKQSNLDSILMDRAAIDLGEKDEFETTVEYENRKSARVEEMKVAQSYLENDYVNGRLERLEESVKEDFAKELEELEAVIQSTAREMESMKHQVNEISYLMQTDYELDDILYYYYHTYHSGIELGLYDADAETFQMNVNGEEKRVSVPRSVAKAFKAQFSQLKPVYKMEDVKDGEVDKIEHRFVYDFEGEEIIVPFICFHR